MNVLDLARPEIRALTPYSSARMEAGAAKVMLNANESPWDAGCHGAEGLNRYPDPQPSELRDALAKVYGVGAEQVLACRGSDEAIDLLLRVFCRGGAHAIVVSPPTFGMYRVAADIHGVDVIDAPLDGACRFDAARVLDAVDARTRLVFVCSPNNPTGDLVPLATLEALAAALTDRAMLVVDEAYIEFAEAPSATSLLPNAANLAVLRTLSKAWALAGARVGALIAHAEVIALCRRVLAPYPLPTPSVALALDALAGADAMQARARMLLAERARLAQRLEALACVRAVLPSRANFLCVRFVDVDRAREALDVHGVVVRDVSRQLHLGDALRIAIGTRVENDALLRGLAALEVPA